MTEIEFHNDEIWQVPPGVRTSARQVIEIIGDNIKFSTLGSKRVNSIKITKMREWVTNNQAFLSAAPIASLINNEPVNEPVEEIVEPVVEAKIPVPIVKEKPPMNQMETAPIAPRIRPQNVNRPAYLPPENKTMLFIDGHALFNSQRALGFNTDFKLLRKFFEQHGYLARSYFYSSFPSGDSPIRKLCEWMEYNDYTVHYTETSHDEFASVNTAVAMTLDVIEQAEKRLDNAVMIVTSAAFAMVMRRAKRLGCHVTLVGSVMDECRMADQLRRETDSFIELRNIIGNIQRPVLPPITR